MSKTLVYIAVSFFIFVFVCSLTLLITYWGQHKENNDNNVATYSGSLNN